MHPDFRTFYPFANPRQEFSSLGEARTFAQNAAAMSLIETAYSFRIENDAGGVNELWTRTDSGWKLHSQKGRFNKLAGSRGRL